MVTAVCWVGLAARADDAPPSVHRVFPSSRFSIDQILTRPYDPDVPLGSVGQRMWASSPQGWAFRDDVHWLYLTNLHAIDIELRDSVGLLQPAQATYYPSHVHLSGASRATTATASFTYTIDHVQNPLTRPFRPEKRWTCWSSGHREDWYAVDFGERQRLTGLRVYFYDDAPTGGCRPPESFRIERWPADAWAPVESTERSPANPSKGENVVRFSPLETDRLRLVVRNAGEQHYTGLYGLELIQGDRAATRPPSTPLQLSGDKFIAADDVLVATLDLTNPTQAPVPVSVRLASPLLYPSAGAIEVHEQPAGFRLQSPPAVATLHGERVHFQLSATLEEVAGLTVKKTEGGPTAEFQVPAGKTSKLRLVVPFATDEQTMDQAASRWLAAASPVALQQAEYQRWFDDNLAYFDCSDPSIRKMYYHRAYNLRKNSLDPHLGRMQWKTFSEGRWRTTWYPNVISYGAAHQVREARWLRDPAYWQGHLRTFAENEKANGVYPSHVKPAGPQDRQYTDWITSSAWDGHLVHPDRQFLGEVVDRLAENVRGWQKQYDPDDDGLLLVDDHWWTGMEWQPSFFAFADYKTDPKDRMQPLVRTKIERLDLTAYNYGNAVAVAHIYRELGQPEQAAEFDALAEKIGRAVAEKMWDPAEKYFYSLRFEDKRKANVKEVIGVYPFYFGMLPLGKGYEQAWGSIVDPAQFWTPWPVASASLKCPAYSQTGWPTDIGGSGCMWNGPTWPHANSIVLTAMARTLRAHARQRGHAGQAQDPQSGSNDTAAMPLSREHLWQLFHSFTLAQYRDQDLEHPWTGEFYDGLTGRWKTAERDYHHSTWLDVLIPEIIGIVPRADDTLEVDPLLPVGKLSSFLLDGQRYHGRSITVVWDDPSGGNDRYEDGRRGLDVYVDGSLRASAPRLERLEIPLRP